ncbi:MAG: hypothetical protein KDH09_18160 [Chrysiogenetes bacterium]|nr:hypothetical protein [Chrysiogenetes bacterium]
MQKPKTRRVFTLIALMGVFGVASIALAYRLPPEKLVQYWAGRILRYHEFEVRMKHQRFDPEVQEQVPDVSEARILFARDGAFRIERTDPKVAPLVVVGNGQESLAVAGTKDLGRAVAARYDFPWLFSIGKAISPEELEALQNQYVLIDSGYVLWMLTRIAKWGIAWNHTKLAPYGDGEVGYLMGQGYGEPDPPEGEPKSRLLFDNRDFMPILLNWVDDAAGTATEYKTVMSGYGNDILRHFPSRIQIFVGGKLTDEFTLLSARLSPKYMPEEVDPAVLRGSLAPEDDAAGAPEKPAPKPAAPEAP